MKAALVYDGGDTVIVPSAMGTPLENQMQGRRLENLGELASRICYDSLGTDEAGKPRGRSSELLHAHIRQVINLSVYEHGNFTIEFVVGRDWEIMATFINRKGVWLEKTARGFSATINFRVVLEWARHSRGVNQNRWTEEVGQSLLGFCCVIAPTIFTEAYQPGGFIWDNSRIMEEDLNEDQIWISLYLAGSRGWSHEMVRHRFAMSQRSTRFVDETDCDIYDHELTVQYLTDPDVKQENKDYLKARLDQCKASAREAYRVTVEHLQNYWIKNKGMMDRTAARKQGRGAARQNMPNGMRTEMIYSAPISGWWWILNQRLSAFADAEIRGVIGEALPILKGCRHGHFFDAFDLVPAKDGLAPILEDVLMPTPSLRPPTW